MTDSIGNEIRIGKLIAELIVDSRNYYTRVTPNFYNGLQLNMPIGQSYAGITLGNPKYAPKSSTLHHASLEFRAVVCPNAGEDYFLTMHYYNDGWSLKHHDGYSLSFNYAFSWNTQETPFLFAPAFITQGEMMRRLGMNEADAKLYDTTVAIDAHRFGMLPLPSNNSAIKVSCTADIGKIEFRQVRFNVKTFLDLLEVKQVIHPVSDYQYSGGIIAGVELWGRARVVLQVRNHSMFDSPPESIGSISEGKFRLDDSSLWYSNGNAVCQYVNFNHAGVRSVYDISRVLTMIPENIQAGWCPGYDTIPLFD